MENYYDEILDDIENAVRDGNYEEAMFMIRKELQMPYIPADVEQKLQKFRRDLLYLMSDRRKSREVPTEVLLKRLQEDPQSQLSAAAGLCSRNLRECIEEISEYLASDPCTEAAALLVEALHNQEIGDEFTWVKDGVEYSFWPDAVIPPAESEGLREALDDLKAWLENDHPDLYEMCRRTAIHDAYVFLPLSYEKEEGRELALQVLENVSSMMDDGRTYQEVLGRESAKKYMS